MRAPLFLVALAILGCKGKPPPEQKPDPKKVETPGSDKVPPVDNAWTPAQQKDIVLPEGSASAPIKTTVPLSPEKMKTLAALKFNEWESEPQLQGPKQMKVRYTTKSRPFIMVTVVAAPCDPVTCPALDLDTWKRPEHEAIFHYALNKSMQAVKGAVLESGMADFYGQKMVYEYHLGLTTKLDENSNTSATFGHAYTLFWNDGVNQLHVTAEYRDLSPVSQEALAELVPRKTFELITRAYMDYFSHAWGG